MNLSNPSSYTSHTIRRSGTSNLINKNFTEVEVMNAGRWKNANSCRKYQKISEDTKLSIADAFTTSNSLALIKSPPIVSNQCKSTTSLQPITNIFNISMNNARNCNINIPNNDSNTKSFINCSNYDRLDYNSE